MIELQDLTLAYGDKVLLRNATAMIGQRDRIGLTGANGSGKTTLLRILMGEAVADRGSVVKASYAGIGWLPQEAAASRGRSVFSEVESAFPAIMDTRARLQTAADKLTRLDPAEEAYGDTLREIAGMEAELEHAEAGKLESRIETVLAGLGFTPADSRRDCGEFSGGWQMRIALAKLLLRAPSLLLLDEPTNHLDIASLNWLEKYLKAYPGALLIVSHDRRFLDQLTERTFALESGRLECYAGNYSFYEKESASRRELALQAKKKQDRKLEQTERFIARFRYKSTKAAQVQSRIKQLDKVERIEIESEGSQIQFRFPPAPRCGQKVMKITGLHKAYGDHVLFKDMDLVIERGDRIAIVGNNGAGKSTLVRILAGEEAYQSGSRLIGHNVQLAFFAQHQAEALDTGLDVIRCMEAAMPAGRTGSARDLLGSFLFGGDDVFKKVGVLSGGEKSRLALARMLAQSANLLIMDEPTNHLDMRSKDILREALGRYDGSFVIVSHDRDFLDPLVDKVLEVGLDGPRWFAGNLSYYLTKLEAMAANVRPVQTGAPSAGPQKGADSARDRRRATAERNRTLAPLRKRAAKLEQDLIQWEAEQAQLEAKMADGGFYQDAQSFQEHIQIHRKLKAHIESAYAEWENLELQINRD